MNDRIFPVSGDRIRGHARSRTEAAPGRDRPDPDAIAPTDEERIIMVKATRLAGRAPPLVIGVIAGVLTVALTGGAGTRPAVGPLSAPAPEGIAAAPDPGGISRRSVRLEDFQRDGRRQDEQHLRKREWHRHWDNRLDFWDPSHGRKVFVG